MFLTKMNKSVKRLIKNKDGASAIEYVIVAAMVTVVAVAFITPIGDAVKAKLVLVTEGIGGTAPK